MRNELQNLKDKIFDFEGKLVTYRHYRKGNKKGLRLCFENVTIKDKNIVLDHLWVHISKTQEGEVIRNLGKILTFRGKIYSYTYQPRIQGQNTVLKRQNYIRENYSVKLIKNQNSFDMNFFEGKIKVIKSKEETAADKINDLMELDVLLIPTFNDQILKDLKTKEIDFEYSKNLDFLAKFKKRLESYNIDLINDKNVVLKCKDLFVLENSMDYSSVKIYFLIPGPRNKLTSLKTEEILPEYLFTLLKNYQHAVK